jgi:cysteine-rich repeat protein
VCTVSGTICATSNDCPTGEGCCGNSIHESGEQCDDGNLAGGDCCSSTCQDELSTSCTPSLCAELGIFGPHVVPASEKQLRINDAKLDGTMEKWSNSGGVTVFSGRTMDPSEERVVIAFSENDGANGRTELHRVTLEPAACTPAAACFVPNKQNTTWRYRDQRRASDPAAACGFDAGVFRKASQVDYKFQLKGKSDTADQCSYEFTRPTGTLIREDIVVGDECATVLLSCRIFGGNKTYRCVPQ